jgi:hypothetical protein
MNKVEAIQWVDDCFLSKEMQDEYIKLLEERYLRIVKNEVFNL